jgi:hypothetical protein
VREFNFFFCGGFGNRIAHLEMQGPLEDFDG